MRQTYKIIPIYTADVSGVCSALYELGGMTVMHDPSGCNSTYNTHDEIRWYDQDSMIYISGLTEIDAVMGNDEKLIRDIEIAAEELKPKFIALAGSPIPYMNGTDFEAIAKILEQDLGIPAFSVPTNGMHDYVYGVGRALAEIAKRIEGKREVTPKSVNLLGVTPLDFGPQEHVDALIQNVEQAGWKVLSTWAMGDTLENLARAPEAEVNLVVSSTGLRAAEILQERFGTPYVTGTPIRGFMKTLLNAIEEKKQVAYLEKGRHIGLTGNELEKSSENQIILIGEPVIMESLAAVIETEYQISVRVICPLREKKGLLADGDIAVCGEEELEQAQKELNESSGKIAAGEKELNEKSIALATLKEQKDTLQGQLAALEQQKEELSGQKTTLEAQKRTLQEGQKNLLDTQAVLQQQISRLKAEKEDLNAEGIRLSEEKETLQKEYEELKSQYEASGDTEILKQVEAKKAQLDEVNAKIAENSAKIEQNKTLLETVESQMDPLEEKLVQMKNGLEQTETALEKISAGLSEIEAGQEQMQTGLTQMESYISSGEFQLQAAREQLESGKNQILSGQRQIEDARKRIADGEEQIQAGIKQIQDGETGLADGWIEYQDGERQANAEIADGEAQIAENAQQGTDKAVQQRNAVIDPEIAGEQVDDQGVKQHTDHGEGNAAQCTLNGLVGADHGRQLVPPEFQADKVSACVGHERHHEGNQDDIPADVHIQNTDEGAEHVGDEKTRHKAHGKGFKVNLYVVEHHLREHQDEERDHEDDKVGMNRAKIAPHAHGGRHDAGVDHQPRPLHQSRPVKKLVGRDGHKRAHDQ